MVEVHVDMSTVTFWDSDGVEVVITSGEVIGVVIIENEKLVKETWDRPRVV